MNKLLSLVMVALVGCADTESREDVLLAPEQDAGEAALSDAGAAVTPERDAAVSLVGADAAQPRVDAGELAQPDAGPAPHVERFVSLAELRSITDLKCISCHNLTRDAQPGPMPWLERSALGDAFPNHGTPSNCGAWSYIEPGDPELSLLYAKLKPAAPCGAHPAMPSPPSAEQIELIGDAMRSWGAL